MIEGGPLSYYVLLLPACLYSVYQSRGKMQSRAGPILVVEGRKMGTRGPYVGGSRAFDPMLRKSLMQACFWYCREEG